MEATRTRATHPLIIIAAVAIILFCAAGFAAIMGWIPKSGADTDLPEATKAVATTKTAAATPKQAAKEPVQPKQAAKPVCRDCGVIQSVNAVEKAGEGSGVGAVAGGVVGGVVGHQIGNGRGQDLATVAGAVGGAVAGHHIEKHVKKTTVYNVTVKLDDGTTRVLTQSQAPTYRSGDRVRIVDGNLQSI
jgi:outer membrane lipoprotein SlyB